ncbi:MAG: hypothetical protein WCE68_16585 [Anaerolineales bacterium]
MDNFELKPEPKVERKPIIWNILTVIVLLGTCGLLGLFFNIFTNPTSMLPSSLRPAPLPTLYQSPTPTPTIILQPPTWTPTLTIQPSPTRTKAPTWTLVPALLTPSISITPITITPIATTTLGTKTITPTAMPASIVITYQSVTTIHSNLACSWMGVGGKVLDANNKPLTLQTVQLGGTLNGQAISGTVLSGNSPAYGTSGFEFAKLADSPIASKQTLWIQLFDNNGKPLTGKTYFDTFEDCTKNLVMVVFTVTR